VLDFEAISCFNDNVRAELSALGDRGGGFAFGPVCKHSRKIAPISDKMNILGWGAQFIDLHRWQTSGDEHDTVRTLPSDSSDALPALG
jgi:hypothetical protein